MTAVVLLVVVAAVPDAIAHPLVHEAARLHRIFKLLDRNDDRVLSAVEAVTGLGVGLEDQSHSQLCAQASTLVSSWPAPCGYAFSLLTDYEIDVVDFADCVKSWGAEALLASDACGSGGAAPTLSFETSLSIFAGGLASTIVEAPPTQPPRPHVDAASPSATPVRPNATILLSSDWHIEPWYAGDAWNATQPWFHGGVLRFKNPNNNNMRIDTCADGATGTTILPCRLAHSGDPPISHAATHFEAFANRSRQLRSVAVASATAATPPSLFYMGDTQAHLMNFSIGGKGHEWNFTQPYQLSFAIDYLMKRLLTLVLSHFSPDDVYWVGGNHDGPEDSLFCHESVLHESQLWAQVLVDEGVVTNHLGRRYAKSAARLTGAGSERAVRAKEEDSLDQVGFFLETGYYLKRFAATSVSAPPLFVMGVNANLGRSNPRQEAAMKADLDFVRSQGGGVYVLGHQPSVMTSENFAPNRKEHHDLLRGSFGGHIHSHKRTNRSTLYTQVGSVDPAGSNSFMVAQVGPAGGYKLIVDPAKDAFVYTPPKAGLLSNASYWRQP